MTRRLKSKMNAKVATFIEKVIVLRDMQKRVGAYKTRITELDRELKEMMKDPELVAKLMDRDLIKVILKKAKA